MLIYSKFCFAISSSESKINFKSSIYSEIGYQNIDQENNNKNLFNKYASITRASLLISGSAESSKDNNINGKINFVGNLIPQNYSVSPTSLNIDSENKIFIKEFLLDYIGDSSYIRFGKEYIAWGNSTFFTPLDVVNKYYDPLRPIEEAEGNIFLNYGKNYENIHLEAYAFMRDKNNNNIFYNSINYDNSYNSNISNVFLVPKVALSVDNFSTFIFSKFEEKNNPYFGINVNLTTTFFSNSALLFSESIFYNSNKKIVLGLDYKYNVTNSSSLDGINFKFEFQKNQSALRTTTNNNAFFSEISFISFLKKDINLDFSFMIDSYSQILKPDLNYSFSNNNATIGFSSLLFKNRDVNSTNPLNAIKERYYTYVNFNF